MLDWVYMLEGPILDDSLSLRISSLQESYVQDHDESDEEEEEEEEEEEGGRTPLSSQGKEGGQASEPYAKWKWNARFQTISERFGAVIHRKYSLFHLPPPPSSPSSAPDPRPTEFSSALYPSSLFALFDSELLKVYRDLANLALGGWHTTHVHYTHTPAHASHLHTMKLTHRQRTAHKHSQHNAHGIHITHIHTHTRKHTRSHTHTHSRTHIIQRDTHDKRSLTCDRSPDFQVCVRRFSEIIVSEFTVTHPSEMTVRNIDAQVGGVLSGVWAFVLLC